MYFWGSRFKKNVPILDPANYKVPTFGDVTLNPKAFTFKGRDWCNSEDDDSRYSFLTFCHTVGRV